MSAPLCRGCGLPAPRILIDLGAQPLANSYVRPETADKPEPTYPLRVRVCDACLLVQADEASTPEDIFAHDYAYFSSFSDSWLAHCKAYATMAMAQFALNADTLVVEIASNDGYLLQYFKQAGAPVLGVEPAANVAQRAIEIGVPTRVAFFGRETAQTMRDEGLAPRLICSANVLAHVPDINDFAAGLAILLQGEAVYTVEFPHLLNLIAHNQFDTIYHEHYSYLSLLAIEKLFARHGLRVFDVEELPTHGGSLRVYACLESASHALGPRVAAVLAKERAHHLDAPEGYAGFEAKAQGVRDAFLSFLRNAKASGKSVAAYGAAAKGNTLLNYCGVGPELISFCVDRNPAKQNTLLPGSRIPVRDPQALRDAPPDFLVILPWNIRDEVIAQSQDLRDRGVRFVTAIPELRVEA
ncbi:MAG: methyltransferase domain-containing protein [Alphaproteobacteria bacterium]|nr:methyltransferase domain-containing protein [Alphaproteobacteria bacterium]